MYTEHIFNNMVALRHGSVPPPPHFLRYLAFTLGIVTCFVIIFAFDDGVGTHRTADAQAFVSVCDRQPAIRDAILAALTSRSDCADVRWFDLLSISTFNLTNANISSISAADFSDLRPVSLVLRGNKLTSIPPGIFTSRLTRLDIRDNNITQLNEDDFAGATNLEILRLNGNNLSGANALHPDALDPATDLEELYMNNAGITNLPNGFLDSLINLERFEAADNAITTIDADFFQFNLRLRTLYLYGNRLTTIDRQWLRTLNRLSAFWIQENKITTIGANAFTTTTDGQTYTGPTALNNLYLHDNEVATIHSDAFKGLNLWTLRLDGNNLASLPSDVFDEMPRVADLRLYGNQLTHIEPGTFDKQTNLRNLYLDRNRLRSIDANIFQNLTRLAFLRLDNNQISEIHADAFANSPQLSTLLMNDNRLTQLPPTIFRETPNLRLLWLYDNQLSEIGANVFRGLANVTDFRLSGNLIETIQPRAFQGMDSLNHLALYRNRLTEIGPDIFSGLSSPTRLWLHGNSIHTIHPNAFQGMTNLDQLLLHGNRLQSLPHGVFRGLDLDMLWLHSNLGAPFQLPIRAESATPGKAFIAAPYGAVFEIDIRIGAINANPTRGGSPFTATTLAAGTSKSPTFDINPASGEQPNISVGLSSAPATTCYGSPCFRGFQYVPGPYPPTGFEDILPVISRIEPQIVTATVVAGQQIRLTTNVFNMQETNANTRFDLKTGPFARTQTLLRWSVGIGDGEFTGTDAPRNVFFTAPETPRTVTITSEALPYGVCQGHHAKPADLSDCIATFTIRVVAPGSTEAPAESQPRNPSGQIPTSLSDDAGTAYEVATPEQGGRFEDENCESCPTVTIPIGAVPDQTFIGVRATNEVMTSLDQGASSHLTILSERTRVTAIDRQGAPLTVYTLNSPMQVCVPFPPEFRSRLDTVALFEFSDLPSSNRLLASEVYSRNGKLTLCGKTDRLPTTLAPARLGAIESDTTPTITNDDLPETGGAAPNTLLALVAVLIGILLTATGVIYLIGSARTKGRGLNPRRPLSTHA